MSKDEYDNINNGDVVRNITTGGTYTVMPDARNKQTEITKGDLIPVENWVIVAKVRGD